MPEAPPACEPRTADGASLTEDTVLGGRVRLLQPRRGYRAGLDAALLAASVEGEAGERLLEAGCGMGGALLQAAARLPECVFVGLERDPEALALAARSLAQNALDGRVRLLEGTVEAGFRALGEPVFDAAFANPPFFDDPATLRGPAPERRGAWLADGGLGAWTRLLLKAVREGGAMTLIHRADRLADLLALMGEGAGDLRIRPVQPFSDAPAKRVLVRGVKASRAPLILLPPFVLHERGGAKHTVEAEALLRGEARLSWDA